MSDNALYDIIGLGYNSTRQADPLLTEKLHQFLEPASDGLFLDLGCGTGNYTIALANKGLDFYGVEPSEGMLEIARSRNNKIQWRNGTAELIPVDDDLFDGAIATLTIHHWTDLEKALKEIYRVLKKDRKIVFFTATPEQMKGYWLNYYFPVMLERSILQMPSLDIIKYVAKAAGFKVAGTEKYFIQDDLKDLFLYSGKNKPGLYFNKDVRGGISSFSALANKEEVNAGLAMLYKDIELNNFEMVKTKFNNDLGDYLFITLHKC